MKNNEHKKSQPLISMVGFFVQLLYLVGTAGSKECHESLYIKGLGI